MYKIIRSDPHHRQEARVNKLLFNKRCSPTSPQCFFRFDISVIMCRCVCVCVLCVTQSKTCTVFCISQTSGLQVDTRYAFKKPNKIKITTRSWTLALWKSSSDSRHFLHLVERMEWYVSSCLECWVCCRHMYMMEARGRLHSLRIVCCSDCPTSKQ